MDFLPLQNKRVAGDDVTDDRHSRPRASTSSSSAAATPGPTAWARRTARAARASTSSRSSPGPPDDRTADEPLAPVVERLPRLLRHEEGGVREYSINTRRFLGEDGRVTALETVRVEMKPVDGRTQFVEIPGTEKVYPADLVLLAMGFVGPEKKGLLDGLGVELDRDGQRQGRRRPSGRASPRSSPPAT